jgi:methanogenic corrinoid protein MtbC1
MDDTALFENMRASVVQGDAARARALAADALRAGLDPLAVLETGFISALRVVGDCWERGDLYLPEMILAAETVKAALDVLKPSLRARGHGDAGGPVCVLGTVRGDIHDIGKNIVGTLLGAFGFTVVDLGTDVEAARFIAAVRTTGAGLVGLSALLTSTMPQMRTVIEGLRDEGLRPGVRVAVGGAPVTTAFASDIGADGTAEDGLKALRLFQGWAAASGVRDAM